MRMADSDDDYIQELSDDEGGAHPISHGQELRSTGGKRNPGQRPGDKQWEVKRSWEQVAEGADGLITSTVEGLLEAGKRKR